MLVKLVHGESPTAHCLTLGQLELYFSYETVIAFRARGIGLIVSENMWSSTTGEYINAIAGKDYPRLPREKFEHLLKQVLTPIAMVIGGRDE